MIKIIEGDLLHSPESEIIIHQVNSSNVMGSGVAKAIYTKYPFVKCQYHDFCNGIIYGNKETKPKELLGKAFRAREKGCERSVINVFGQLNYRRAHDKPGEVHTNYDALRKAFDEIATHYAGCDVTFAIPYGLGSGLAGGNWQIVYSIIEENLKAFDVHIYKLFNNI